MSSAAGSSLSPTSGVVTFLDVLGWKGIWQRQQNAIQNLEELVNEIQTGLASYRGTGSLVPPELKVVVVSDTIVIITECDKSDATKYINIHGSLCAKAVLSSIKKGIPLRGVTSYGEYIFSNSIYVGKAIDEAAAWYELGNWVGVFMTPSAQFLYDHSPSSGQWVQYDPPLKGGIILSTNAVKLEGAANKEGIKDIKRDFLQLGPITPDIESKFSNTIKFLEWIMYKDQGKMQQKKHKCVPLQRRRVV